MAAAPRGADLRARIPAEKRSRRAAGSCPRLGSRHRCSLRGRSLPGVFPDERFPSSASRFSRPWPVPPFFTLAACRGTARGGARIAPARARARDGHTARAAAVRTALRRARDRRRNHSQCRHDVAARVAAHARRRGNRRHRRAGADLERVPARHQRQPRGVAGGRRARELGHLRHQRLREPAARADRAHRNFARPGQQPLRRRRDRRRDSSLYAPGRAHRGARGRGQSAHARGVGGCGSATRCHALLGAGRLYGIARVLSHQRSQRFFFLPRRRPLPQPPCEPGAQPRMGARADAGRAGLAERGHHPLRQRRRHRRRQSPAALYLCAGESQSPFGKLAEPAARSTRQ